MSRNYNTMGTISKEQFSDLMSEMPELEHYFKKHLYEYDDEMETFKRQMMKKIQYFGSNYLDTHLFYEILYKFEIQFYPKGSIILQE